MKTLDEVIKAMEMCTTCPEDDEMCPGCPYADKSGNPECVGQDKEDALHYLKTIETTENLYHDAVNKLSKWEDEDWKDRCLPLTWDELKQMEGKPVWVEYNLHIRNKDFRDKSKRWCIVREFKPWHDIEIIITENGFILSKNEQIKCWQAYRKERS